MPDNPVPQSINDDPVVPLDSSSTSLSKGLGKEGAILYDTAPPLFETETASLTVEKLPLVEITPTIESKQQVIEEAEKPNAQITNKPSEDSSHIVNKATGNEVIHSLRTSDKLTTIADTDEAEFIEEVEQHAHAH